MGLVYQVRLLDSVPRGTPTSLVTSQGAWACQRGVRFDQYMLLRSYHDGYKHLEPVMLWDLTEDPHEQHDLAPERLFDGPS